MSTALATMPPQPLAIQTPLQLPHEIIEALVASGDLSNLTAAQRTSYYKARCEACGLDPSSQPFEYLKLNGKLLLYAKKTATDQLTRLHRISLEITNRFFDESTCVLEVTCRATFQDGRVGEDVGALHLGKLFGENRANAIMKCVTKAKRRTVLAACGLGMLDETEVESVGNARHLREIEGGELVEVEAQQQALPQPSSSVTPRGSGMYTKEHAKATADFLNWLGKKCDVTNQQWHAAWLDRLQAFIEDGHSVPDKIEDVINKFQAKNHLYSWAFDAKLLPESLWSSEVKTRQTESIVARVFVENKAALVAEMKDYVGRQRKLKEDAIYRAFPDLAPVDHFKDEEDDDDLATVAAGPSDDTFEEGRE